MMETLALVFGYLALGSASAVLIGVGVVCMAVGGTYLYYDIRDYFRRNRR